MTDVPVSQEAGKTYPRMTWAASHKHTCNLCHMDKNPADGCNCGAELIDLIRSEMMSDEHPISEWEVRFAEKIKALPMFARHRQQAERDVIARMEGWRPIETAPYDTPVEVRVGSMTFLARLLPDASMSSLDETCDQWQAEIDGEHPPCWSEGACWSSNVDEVMSLQPTAWRLPTPPAGEA